MSHSVWSKLVHIVLLSGLLAVPLLAQDPGQDPSVPGPSEPESPSVEPSSPAPEIESPQGKSDPEQAPGNPSGTTAIDTDTEESTLPQAEDRILASLSPASTWLWVHFKGWKSVLAGDADQQASQALRELTRRDGALVGRIKDFMDGLAGFASSHGFKREGFMDLVAEETELSFFEMASKPDFLLFLPIGGKKDRITEVLTSFWKEWKPEAKSQAGSKKSSIWYAQSPYPYTKQIFVSLEGLHLIFAGSPEAMDLGRGLAKEKGAALAFDEGFQSLFGDAHSTEKSGWFQIFARPRKASRWIFGENEKRRFSQGFISSLPVIGFESRFEKGLFTDHLLFGGGDSSTGLYRLLDAGNLGASFAQKLGKALPDSIRAHLSWRGLQDEMRDNPELSLRLTALETLKEKLANIDDGKSLTDSLDLLTGDLVWLPGNGEDEAPAFILGMKDAFQCKTLLEGLGTAIPAGTELGAGDGYALVLGDETWYAYLDADLLYLSEDQGRCRSLRSVLAVQTSETTQHKDRKPGLIEGRINSLTWLRKADPSGNLGLLALAEWFDSPSLIVRKTEKSFDAETQAITGVLPFALVSVDQLLGRLDLRQAEWNKDFALQLGQRMHEAQKTYMLLIEKDEDADGRGEAGSLTDLIAARRVAESRQYRPWGMDVYERSGYRFRMLLPSKINDRETKFFLLAWPARFTSKRPTCILLDTRGRSYTNELTAELDLDSGLDASQIFAGTPFDSALAAGWELHIVEEKNPTAVTKTTEKASVGTVTELELEAALTLLDKAWKSKDADSVRKFLDYENPQIQARAAHYLGNLKDKKSVPALAGLLKVSKHQILRRSVARALTLIRDPRATATLLEVLTDPDSKVRLYAATAFIANPVPGSLDALLGLVDSYTEDEAGDRSQAMLAIHDLDQPSCLMDLVAVKAGGSRFQQALVYTFQDLSPKLDEAAEARVLIAALSNENKLLRKYAIQRLGEAQYKEAISALESRLTQEGKELQPILQNTMAVLSPGEGTDKLKENFTVLLAKGKKFALESKAKFEALPEPHRYAIMGGGGMFVLVIFFLMGRRRRRKKAAKHAHVLELIEHSDDYQEAHAEGGEEAYDESSYEEDYEGDYQESEETYEEEESYR